jgi:photosystem II stability/assembly factor-like uncharacterized protein
MSQGLRVAQFKDDRKGWVAGQDGLILYTEDGGKTWAVQNPPEGSDILTLHFSSMELGWGWALDGEGGVRFTSNGAEWNLIPVPDGVPRLRYRFNDAVMRGFGEGWAAGPGGRVLHNPDAGPVWELQDTGITDTLRGIYLDKYGFGWAVGPLGTIINTMTNGRRWRIQNGNTGYDLNAVVAASARVGWAVGQYGLILHTADVGVTWTAQQSSTTNDLRGILALSEKEVYIVGDGGTILHTTDGGTTWLLQNAPVETSLWNVSLSSDGSTLWATGAWGVVMRAPRPSPVSRSRDE